MTNGKTRSARSAAKASRKVIAEGPTAPLRSAEKGSSELAGETKGSVFVEYLAILCLVSIGGSAAVISLGGPLIHYYRVTQLVLGLPVP